MNVDKALETIFDMMGKDDPESKIIPWIESQENSQDIFDWFNKYMQSYPNSDTSTASKYAYTFESQIRRSQKGMTEDDMESMSARDRGYTAFSRAMDNIKDAEDSELPKSRYKMIKSTVSAFSDYLMGIYAPKPEEEPNTIPIVMMEKPMTEQSQIYAASDISQLQAEIAQLKKTNQDTLKFSALKDKAITLVNSGKLSPAEYKAKFEGEQAFANYQAALSGNPLESFLNYIDAHVTHDPRLAPSVYGATPLPNQEVPQRPEAQGKDVTAEQIAAETAAQYTRKYGAK